MTSDAFVAAFLFIAYVVLLFVLANIPEQLNEKGFYDTISN